MREREKNIHTEKWKTNNEKALLKSNTKKPRRIYSLKKRKKRVKFKITPSHSFTQKLNELQLPHTSFTLPK